MSRANFGAAIREMERLLGDGTVAGLTERQLLERFVARRDEPAFEALVRRHGPMVLGVCRRLLRDSHDVDDAFQATFLVLVRRAASIRDGDRLGPWLYGVAHRVARRVRVQGARRRERETGGAAMAAHEPAREITPDDFGAELHEELARLPEKYRAPIVLCDLGGCTHEEAARRLGWPIGTVKGRQSRARDLLRDRLARRGLTPTSAAITAALAADAHAAIPPALVHSTVQAAMCLAAGGATTAAAGLASATAVAAAAQVSHAMIWIKLKFLAAGLMSAGIVVSGVGAYTLQGEGGEGAAREAGEASVSQEARQKPGDTGSSPPSSSEQPKPATPDIAKARAALAEARINMVRSQFERLLKEVANGISRGGMGGGMGGGFGRSSIEQAYQASLRILSVQKEALSESFDQPSALAEHLERMKQLQEVLQRPDHPFQGFANQMGEDPAIVDYYVAEAQLWKAEADAGLELTQPPGTTGLSPSGEVPTQGESGDGLTPGGDITPSQLDPRTRSILEVLEKPLDMPFENPTPLGDVLEYIKNQTMSEVFPGGLPMYVDPATLVDQRVQMYGSGFQQLGLGGGGGAIQEEPSQEEKLAEVLAAPIRISLQGVPLKTSLRLLLRQAGLSYIVKEGLILIGHPDSRTFMMESGQMGGEGGGTPGYGAVPRGGFPSPGGMGGMGGGFR